MTTPWAIALWKRLPTPEKALRVRKTTPAQPAVGGPLGNNRQPGRGRGG